jgi:endonuclease YncB( thermonuclease family)
MKHPSMLRFSAFALVVLQVSAAAVSAATLRGRVVSIADGDTLTILDGQHKKHRIRLQGIDAPESAQSFGQVSRRYLSSLVAGRDVTVEYQKFDRYDRIVGKVIVGVTDANLEQVRAGLAWVYTDYEEELSPADRSAYHAAEREARSLHRGLWAENNPTPPWVFRRRSRSTRSVAAGQSPAGAATAEVPVGAVIGNRRSHIFHRPDCPDYLKVSASNRVLFPTAAAAEAAGFRQARNCP